MTKLSTLNRLLDLAVAIQQIPAPTFHEKQRAEFVLERFRAENLTDTEMDEVGNVYARLPGSEAAKPIVVSAHLDTVFPLSTNLHVTRHGPRKGTGPSTNLRAGPSATSGAVPTTDLGAGSSAALRASAGSSKAENETSNTDAMPASNKTETPALSNDEEPILSRSPEQAEGIIEGPGIGDNSLGVAGLFGLLWELHSALPGDVWLVANVGEEGLGNLRGMAALVDRFGNEPLAYLVVEGMSLGQVYHRGLGVQRYRISVDTAGGHSWVDYGRPSAVHILAEIITQLTSLSLPRDPRTTLNVGTISGGTSINTIAAHAQLELDLRSENVTILPNLAARVEALVQQANRQDVRVTSELIGQRPAGQIPFNHPLVRLGVSVLEELGVSPRLNIGSTDANVPLSRGLPSICLGLTSGSGSHTMAEAINIAPLAKGVDQLVRVVEGIFRLKEMT